MASQGVTDLGPHWTVEYNEIDGNPKKIYRYTGPVENWTTSLLYFKYQFMPAQYNAGRGNVKGWIPNHDLHLCTVSLKSTEH